VTTDHTGKRQIKEEDLTKIPFQFGKELQ